jgi:hypothetical protein
MLQYIKQKGGGSLVWMAMVGKFDKWATASCGLTDKDLLAQAFRDGTGYAGKVYYCDATWGALLGYDVKCSGNGTDTPTLTCRTTPQPLNWVRRASTHVFLARRGELKVADGVRVAESVPVNTDGWGPLPGNWWHRMKHL